LLIKKIRLNKEIGNQDFAIVTNFYIISTLDEKAKRIRVYFYHGQYIQPNDLSLQRMVNDYDTLELDQSL